MLNFKHNVCYLIIAKRPELVKEAIDSCLSQTNVNPYVIVVCESRESFYEAKLLCTNPIIYEPNVVSCKNMLVVHAGVDEKSAMINMVNFGRSKNCQYYCICLLPSVLNKDFSKRSVAQIKDVVIGTYTNMMDSGLKVYTSISGMDSIYPGTVIFLKKEIATAFNHEKIGDFIRFCISNGCLYHFEEFLAEIQWIKFM